MTMSSTQTYKYFFYVILIGMTGYLSYLILPFFSAIFLAYMTVTLTHSIYKSIQRGIFYRISQVQNSFLLRWIGKVFHWFFKKYRTLIKWISKFPPFKFLFRKKEILQKPVDSNWETAFSSNLSILLTVSGVFIVGVLSIGLLFVPTINEVQQLSNTYFDEAHLVEFLNTIRSYIETFYTIDFTTEEIVLRLQEYIQPIIKFLSDQLLTLTGTASEWFTNGILYILFLIYLYPNFESFIKMLKDFSPLPNDQDQQILDRMYEMTKATVVGTWVVAFIQATITCLVFLAIDFPYPFFMGFLAFLLSLIPAVGPAVFTIPFAFYYIFGTSPFDGYLLLVITAVNSLIDLLIRPVFTPKSVRLNTALFTLSVFAGLQAFGILGLLYGPIIFIVFVTIVEIYFKEYKPAETE